MKTDSLWDLFKAGQAITGSLTTITDDVVACPGLQNRVFGIRMAAELTGHRYSSMAEQLRKEGSATVRGWRPPNRSQFIVRVGQGRYAIQDDRVPLSEEDR